MASRRHYSFFSYVLTRFARWRCPVVLFYLLSSVTPPIGDEGAGTPGSGGRDGGALATPVGGHAFARGLGDGHRGPAGT